MLEVGDTAADDGLRGFTPDERDTLVRLTVRRCAGQPASAASVYAAR